MSMTLEEYFDQRRYFSESSGKMMNVRGMPFQHAVYAFIKLFREHGDEFVDTPLFFSFLEVVAPSPSAIRTMLKTQGSVAHIHYGQPGPIRQKIRRAAARAGLSVRMTNGAQWVQAEIFMPVQATVKGRPVATS